MSADHRRLKPVEPILVADLFPGLHHELMRLLRSLSPEDWLRPTAAGHWRVRDVVAHLLDGDMRQISFRRDALPPVDPPFPINGYADLVRFLDGLNADWVAALQRVSPRLLADLHAVTGPEVSRIFGELDPFGDALFGVAWAGESGSMNWFDTAREYTERWHHQQQIRDAVDAPPLTSRRWLHPVLDTFLRALPHRYRDVTASDAASLGIEIRGEAGSAWTLRREEGAWHLYEGLPQAPSATIRCSDDTAWRMMTKGIGADEAAARSVVEGEQRLAHPFFGTLAIMG